MSHPSNLISRSIMVGMLVVSTSQGAAALTVTRCNQLDDGAFRPVLIVEQDGQTHVHTIGEDGLTRSVLFNASAALEWAKARYGADATVPASYVENCGADTGNSGLKIASAVGDDDDDDTADDDDDDDDEGAMT